MTLNDKTLVAWVKLATLDQRGAGVLAIEQWQPGSLDHEWPKKSFDALVFGEISPGCWMAGSDEFKRTQTVQDDYAAETADPDTVIQMAIVYQGSQVTLLRDGQIYASYDAGQQQSFAQPFLLLLGRRHLAASPAPFAGAILDARIYDQALPPATVATLEVGVPSLPAPLGWWCFADPEAHDRMGHFQTTELKFGARLENGELVLDGQGALLVASTVVPPAREPLLTVPVVPPEPLRTARLLRERLLADPYRPGYHFAMSEDMAIPGDPNGAFYHQGRYHLMYLYNRRGVGFCWGHLSSHDLVHWRNHPDALSPDDLLDPGIFSGGAFVDDDGTAYLSYWKLGKPDGVGIACSRDHAFHTWEKFGPPVIASTDWGITELKDDDGQPLYLGSADPSNIWKHKGRYYLLTGNLLVLNQRGRADDAPTDEQGDRLYLFVSDDLRNWKYLHPFYDRNPAWTDRSEDNMCPSFLPLPASPAGGPPSGKHLLLFIAHNRGCQYYLGDYRDDRFFPDLHGRMSWVDSTYFAPEALVDGQGRQIMWVWLMGDRDNLQPDGWSGVYGLPRTLWLGEDGTLRLRPVPELETLRMNQQSWSDIDLPAGEPKRLEVAVGHSCELWLDLEPGAATRCGVKVLASPAGEEETILYYDAETKQLVVDTTRGGVGGRPAVESAPFELRPGEPLRLRVFVDRSVVELFANDRQAICRRVFPARPDSLGVALFAAGAPARCRQATAWEMTPANPH